MRHIALGLLLSVLMAHAEAPVLQIQWIGGMVALSWRVSPSSYALESSSSLASNSWSRVTNAPGFADDRFVLELPLAPPHQFFRLSGASLVPIFQFQVFYELDLEINNGPGMAFNGRVHSNTNLYAASPGTLTFSDAVTAGGTIRHSKSPFDPVIRSNGTVVYDAAHASGTTRLTLPIGTNQLRQIVEAPPAGEDRLSDIGRQRFYNKADVVVLVSNEAVTVTSGALNNFALPLPELVHSNFVRTQISFYDYRQTRDVAVTQIDIAAWRAWSSTNVTLRPILGRDIRSIYVADFRTLPLGELKAVRLVNGQTLPPLGLTVATPNPLYVQGHFNQPNPAHIGTINTSNTVPAALVADSITVLSSAWSDARSAQMLIGRPAVNTTLNAALLGGIVPSDGSSYSGGLENLPRLLEDWAGRTFTHNGSMAVLFTSKHATGFWGGPGVYSPPVRAWNFDRNFLEPAKLPPSTPILMP